MSVREAVEAGDRQAALRAQWLRLAKAVDDAPIEDLPALSRELRLVSKELEDLPVGVVDMEDALAARRAAKQAADG